MKKLWIIAGAVLLVSFILAGKAWAQGSHHNQACRNYTKNAFYNGAAQLGRARSTLLSLKWSGVMFLPLAAQL